jgi:hypothetical protein
MLHANALETIFAKMAQNARQKPLPQRKNRNVD